jgi:hypothetical protein
MKRLIFRVLRRKTLKRWVLVRPDGVETPHTSKVRAVDAARKLANRVKKADGRAQLVINGRDGRIQREFTYGNDPRRHVG